MTEGKKKKEGSQLLQLDLEKKTPPKKAKSKIQKCPKCGHEYEVP